MIKILTKKKGTTMKKIYNAYRSGVDTQDVLVATDVTLTDTKPLVFLNLMYGYSMAVETKLEDFLDQEDDL